MPLYFVVTALVRVALLAFYLRVFGTRGAACIMFKRWNLAMVLKITIVLSLVAMVAFSTAVIFQCTPISYFWDRIDGVSVGTCVNSGVLINHQLLARHHFGPVDPVPAAVGPCP